MNWGYREGMRGGRQKERKKKRDFGPLWSTLSITNDYKKVFKNLSDMTDFIDAERRLQLVFNKVWNRVFGDFWTSSKPLKKWLEKMRKKWGKNEEKMRRKWEENEEKWEKWEKSEENLPKNDNNLPRNPSSSPTQTTKHSQSPKTTQTIQSTQNNTKDNQNAQLLPEITAPSHVGTDITYQQDQTHIGLPARLPARLPALSNHHSNSIPTNTQLSS